MRRILTCTVIAQTAFFAAALTAPTARAEERSAYEVKAAVETWVRYETADAIPDAEISKIEPYIVDGLTVAYVAHIDDGGFCICGADDLSLPVYLYSPESEYDPENPAVKLILSHIAQGLQILRDGSAIASGEDADRNSQRAAYWHDLVAGISPIAEGVAFNGEEVRLPLTSKWGQGAPYNAYCPMLPATPQEQTITGCTATATAMLMNYWQWPPNGGGTASVNYDYRSTNAWLGEPLNYDPNIPAGWAARLRWTAGANRLEAFGWWDGSYLEMAKQLRRDDTVFAGALDRLYGRMTGGSTPLFVNLAAQNYNYGIMPDSPPSPPNAGALEVAKLIYHVGVALPSGYGVNLTGSNSDRPRVILSERFGYDTDITRAARDWQVLIEDIRWYRPVLMGGSGPAGGHEWVIHGFHDHNLAPQALVNFGWAGSSDGWYTLDSVAFPFTMNQDMITRAAPAGVARFVGNSTNGDGSPNSPHRTIQDGLAAVPDWGRVVMKAGSTHNVGGGIINKRCTLNGAGVMIRQ